jgi:hypothetical protein
MEPERYQTVDAEGVEMKAAKRSNGASHQAEAWRQQREAPVHCLEPVREQQDHCDIARRGNEVGYKPAVDRQEGEFPVTKVSK